MKKKINEKNIEIKANKIIVRKFSPLLQAKINRFEKNPDELFFIRATTKDEILKKKIKLGDYWRFVEKKNKLKEAIESNVGYILNKMPYIIIGKGKYDELELEKGVSKTSHAGEMYYSAKELFSNEYNPSSKILYKGLVYKI